jgi:hypothetical protein
LKEHVREKYADGKPNKHIVRIRDDEDRYNDRRQRQNENPDKGYAVAIETKLTTG